MKPRNFSKFNLAYRNYHKMVEANPEYFFTMKCACGLDIFFKNKGKLKVNIESDGYYHIGCDFYVTKGCQNPMCEWSKVKENE